MFRMMFCTTVLSLLAATSLQAVPITVPTSLNPGDQYRLAFVTSNDRDAESPFIADYNHFVQVHADAVPELWSLGVSWNAIGSTFDDDARDNTGTNPNVATGVPIFLLNDTKLVDDNLDLWDGTLDTPLQYDEQGVLFSAGEIVWTGTQNNGTGFAGFELGVDNVTFMSTSVSGLTDRTDSLWVFDLFLEDNFRFHSMYALSEILTVVPEPSTFLLLSVAGMGAIVGYPSRARRRHRN